MKWLSPEDTSEMTNSQRAERAHEAAVEYAKTDDRVEAISVFAEEPTEHDPDCYDTVMAEVLSDLLCDLQHLADWYGVDWDFVLDHGQGCHDEEVAEETIAVEAMADGAPQDEGNETWETDGSEPMQQAMDATIASGGAGGSSGVTATIDNEDGKA